jgi:hypothetical protein
LASVKQLGSQLVNGDTLAIMVSFKSGGHALISAILATPFDGRFAVYGSKGWVEVRDKTHPEKPTGWTFTKVVRGANGGPESRESKEYAPAPRTHVPLRARLPQSQMIANISAPKRSSVSFQRHRQRLTGHDHARHTPTLPQFWSWRAPRAEYGIPDEHQRSARQRPFSHAAQTCRRQ